MLIGVDAVTILPGRCGGIETYAVELLRALTQLPGRQRFIIFAQPALQERVAIDDPRVRFVPTPTPSATLGQAFVLEQSWLPLRAQAAGVRVLHHLKNYASLSLGFRQVLTLHDLFPHYFVQHHFRRHGAAYLPQLGLMLASAARVDHVVTVSQATADHLEAVLGGRTPSLSVTPLAPKRLDDDAAPPPAGLPPEYFLALGKTLPYKNLPRLVRAFLAAPTRRPLVLAGVSGWRDAGAAAEVHRLAATSDGRVRLIGAVAEADLARLYRHARALVFPSLIEGFGLPPLEAASLGVPVAASDIAVHREVLGDAALLFDPLDEHAMTRALVRLDSDDLMCRTLADAGRRRCARFSWQETARRTLAVYERVAA